MKISVIIPAYRAEQWTRQCLENLVCQTHKDLEVVFVYDESGDRTGEIAQRYANAANAAAKEHKTANASAPHPTIEVIRLVENGGLSVARNVGLDHATGDYVHFLDVDDLINVDFYSRMAEAAELADADVACCGTQNETNPYWNHTWHERWVLVTPEDKFAHLNVFDFGYCWRYIFRRQFLIDRGLRFEGRMMEDMPFTQPAILWANKVITVPGAMYYYKWRITSSNTNRNPEHARQRHAAWLQASDARREFMTQNGLLNARPPMNVWEYKIFGLPLLLKRRRVWGSHTRWYLLGLNILSIKQLRRK